MAVGIRQQDERWKRCSWKKLFRIILLRVLPLLTASIGVIVTIIGCSGRFGSERLRVAGISMISLSLFWFVWGNFIDFCVNGYGRGERNLNTGTGPSSHETKV